MSNIRTRYTCNESATRYTVRSSQVPKVKHTTDTRTYSVIFAFNKRKGGAPGLFLLAFKQRAFHGPYTTTSSYSFCSLSYLNSQTKETSGEEVWFLIWSACHVLAGVWPPSIRFRVILSTTSPLPPRFTDPLADHQNYPSVFANLFGIIPKSSLRVLVSFCRNCPKLCGEEHRFAFRLGLICRF